MKKLKGFLALIRFELPLAAGICVVLGQLFALGEFAPLNLTVTGFFSVFLISASILVSNDYFDIETDKINAPHRPIPSNLVSPGEALVTCNIFIACRTHAELFNQHSCIIVFGWFNYNRILI